MMDKENFFTSFEQAIFEGRYSDAEVECNRLLTLHQKSGKANDLTVITLLHSLAQAQERQAKYPEGLATRVRVRDMLLSFLAPS